MCCMLRGLNCHWPLTSKGDAVESECLALRQRPQKTRRHCLVVAAHHHQSGGHHCGRGREKVLSAKEREKENVRFEDGRERTLIAG